MGWQGVVINVFLFGCFVVDKIAVGALLFFVIKTIHNMVGFGCVL